MEVKSTIIIGPLRDISTKTDDILQTMLKFKQNRW